LKKHGIKELNYFGKGGFEKSKTKMLKPLIPSTFIPKISERLKQQKKLKTGFKIKTT
jgi:hypothetical protein